MAPSVLIEDTTMAKMSKDRVTVSSTKNQMRFECKKLILKDKSKSGPLILGKFRVDVQLTFQELSSIDPKLHKMCHEESLKVIGRASEAIDGGLEQLRKITLTQQKKEKSGDKKARKVADTELKKLNKIIMSCQNSLGTDLRKSMEALLKKQGIKGKASATARNQFAKVTFDQDAFSAVRENDGLDEKSTKAWGKLGKGELALSDKHAAINQEIKLRSSLARTIAPFVEGREGDINAAKKELAAYRSHGQKLTKLLSGSDHAIAAMVKQIKKNKKSINPKVSQRLLKELSGLQRTTNSVFELIEAGITLAEDVAGVLQSTDAKTGAAQYKKQYVSFIKGVATIKTQTKKSGTSAKVIEALSKTLTKKK